MSAFGVMLWIGQTLASWGFFKITENIHLVQDQEDAAVRKPQDTIVTFFAGQDPSFNDSIAHNNNPGGTKTKILLWDELGHFLGGQSKRLDVPPGNPRSITVRQRNDNRIIPSYMSLTAGGNDAICLAAIHISYPSDQGSALILGDAMVKLCHWQGYPSEARIVLDEGMHRWHRFWIDGDDSYNEPWNESRLWFPTQHKIYSMNLHLPDFEGSNDTIDAYNDDAQLLCNSDARLQPRPDFRGTVPIFVPALVYLAI